jgi:hypothetical protein
MSRPIASSPTPWGSLALVAALLVATPSIAASSAPVKKKPSATAKTSAAKAQPAGKSKGSSGVKATAKKAPAPVAKPTAPVATAKRDARPAPKGTATAKAPVPKVAAVAARPEPQMYVPPPLGPERYYPNGIPELRPEFLHPVPAARPQASAQDAMNNPAFTAPQ